ncbi:hypothetical protein SAMN05421810_111118 [Amycolatopsis arida]|uniref:Uncharacterized protein n=1 Tax=Amycolatopsis arida TaxID=587909 RepID=A0A1I6A6Y1_9PSEU|nr:hypothetical protein [Amycolatopsis arida]TDX88577.1 hypothetical protein CLV69_11195 [Amycolatopsis arida]SFQ64277.1 hypothetical protein SAMN05421810_111118 [Amycolatopsis arida]
MSLFGQVWLWSLAAFVLGALLTWALLLRPAQARILELERRLAAVEGRTRPPEPAPTRISPAPGEPDESTRQASAARPVDQEPADVERTEIVSPQPGWLERDSLAEHGHVDREEREALAEYDWDADAPVADLGGEYRPRHATEPALGTTGSDRDTAGSEPVEEPVEEPEPFYRPGLLDGEPREPAAERYPAEHPAGLGPDFPAEPAGSSESSEAVEPAEPERAGPDSTSVLPKRQRRESPPGGFDAPQPIQPSMRTVSRREPAGDSGGSRSGSLFEPVVPASQGGAPEYVAPPPPPARAPESTGPSVPSGPFGPGSAMPLPGGGRPAPDFTVKASVTALRYCAEGSPQFDRMVAEVWFRTPADAERVGFRPLS